MKIITLPIKVIVLLSWLPVEGSVGDDDINNVTPIKSQAPTVTLVNFQVEQDADTSATITATDPEGTTVTFAQTSNPNDGTITAFTTNGMFIYRPNADFNGADSFTFTVSDGVNEVAVTITLNVIAVIPPNEAPSITSATTVNVNEDTDGVIYTATASDTEGNSLSFSVSSGADQDAFSIDSATGELSFTSAVDFEAPSDANADNTYEVTIEVSDGSDQLDLRVTVNDVSQLALHVYYPTPNTSLGGVTATSVVGFTENLEDSEVLESDIRFIGVNVQEATIELQTNQAIRKKPVSYCLTV